MVDWTSIREENLAKSCESLLPPTVKLPILPRAVTEFTRRADDPETTTRQLGTIIETDAGLTCGLLRHVNSSAFGLRHKVQSPQQAINILGIRSAKLAVISCSVREAALARQSKLINLQEYSYTSLERAILAREVAANLNTDGELAYAAALLQDYLLPIITNELFDLYLEFTIGQEQQPVALVDFEEQKLGWNHAYAGGQIMLDWGFPDDLICCVLFHHRGQELLNDERLGSTAAAAVAVSALIPDVIQQTPNGLDVLIQLQSQWQQFDLEAVAGRVQEEFESMVPQSSNHITFWQRCRRALQVA